MTVYSFKSHTNAALWTHEDIDVARFRCNKMVGDMLYKSNMLNGPLRGDERDSRIMHARTLSKL